MDKVDCKNLIFTSSVAVYGLNKSNPDENFNADPFNHYGKSKWQTEQAIKHWVDNDPDGKSATIIQPKNFLTIYFHHPVQDVRLYSKIKVTTILDQHTSTIRTLLIDANITIGQNHHI